MVELSCLKAQEALALAGLISDAARQIIEQLPAVEVLMPKLSFAEVNGTRPNAARWLKPLSLAKIYLLTPRPSMPPATFIARGDKPGGDTVDFCWLFRAGLLRRIRWCAGCGATQQQHLSKCSTNSRGKNEHNGNA